MVIALDSRFSSLGETLACDMYVLCFWARHFTLRVPLSARVYKWALMH